VKIEKHEIGKINATTTITVTTETYTAGTSFARLPVAVVENYIVNANIGENTQSPYRSV